jgi:hypothetical protein
MGNPLLLMVAIMVLVMVVGTAMDMTPTILILTPVLMPVVKAAGIDPVYFGVMFIINNSIGLVTPPVGTGAQRGGRRRPHEAGRRHARRAALHGRAVRHDVPDGAVPPQEQKIRGGDAVADWIVLLSSYETEALQHALANELSPQRLMDAGALAGMTQDIYALSYSLGKHDLEPLAARSA